MKKIFLLLFLFPAFCNAQINYKPYNNKQPVLMDDYTRIADSLQKANSGWHVASLQEMQQIQKTLKRTDWKVMGSYWVNSQTVADGIVYCFISDDQFKLFLPDDATAGGCRVMLVRSEKQLIKSLIKNRKRNKNQ